MPALKHILRPSCVPKKNVVSTVCHTALVLKLGFLKSRKLQIKQRLNYMKLEIWTDFKDVSQLGS